MIRSHRQLPPIPNGYPLEDGRSWFGIVIPLARTNEVINPSLESGTTGYTAGAGTLTRTTDEQYHGLYSLKYTPSAAINDGCYYTVSTVSGEVRAFSCKFKGTAGKPYAIAINNTVVDQAVYAFRATGRWQWVWVLHKAPSSGAPRFYVRKNGDANVLPFYVDGVQAESCEDGILAPTTYIDGDQSGLVPNQSPPAFYWTGTPHGSTSVRSGQTRAGGYVMPFSKYAFLLTAIIGLGMIAPTDVAVSYAQLDGAQYERTVFAPRQFTLGGRIQARTASDLDRKRAALAAALARDVTGLQQPLTLLYQRWDGERAASDVARLYATYQSGLDGAADNHYAETITPTFRMYVPFVVADQERGAALDVQDSVSNANYIIRRTVDGTWQSLGTGITGTIVNTILVARDGSVYVGGNFTNAGSSGADYIARYLPDSDTWSVVGSATALNGEVRALVEGPDGSIYAGGAFTNAGGVAAADYIAKWNGSAWSALGTGANADGVYALAFDSGGNLYAGGSFTLMGGVANTVRIAKWNGSAWSALGTGANISAVWALAWSRDGHLYAGGDFTQMSGIANTSGVARWNGTTWQSITTESLSRIYTIAIGPDNRVYFGGTFLIPSIGDHVLVYNGVGLAPVGSTSSLTGEVWNLTFLPDGRLLAGSSGATFDGNLVDDALGVWNGSSWEAVMVNFPSSGAQVIALAAAPDGSYYVGSNWGAGTAAVPGRTTITNNGSAKTYPTLTIKGPSSGTAAIAGIENLTTGRVVRLLSTAEFVISAGETWTFVFEPSALSFVSDVQGNINARVRPGSNEADFFLAPGENVIALYSSSTTVTATLTWRERYGHLGQLTL